MLRPHHKKSLLPEVVDSDSRLKTAYVPISIVLSQTPTTRPTNIV